ncbi:MAG: hypothetical protein KAY24_18725, partial [Candidatus Eisenbacteria sp.]|nr:hypothetical protein [Candidatus Eisenbacteria bacterium]
EVRGAREVKEAREVKGAREGSQDGGEEARDKRFRSISKSSIKLCPVVFADNATRQKMQIHHDAAPDP